MSASHHSSEHTSTITRLLDASRRGDTNAMDALFDRVYGELQQIARCCITSTPARADLSPATLVHAACERLLAQKRLTAEDRRHFFFLFGRAMHDIVVEEARRATAIKRTPPKGLKSLSTEHVHMDRSTITLSELERLLREFHQVDPDAAEVVRLRCLAGRSFRQTAEDLGITLAAVRAHWSYAKAWLTERVEGSCEREA